MPTKKKAPAIYMVKHAHVMRDCYIGPGFREHRRQRDAWRLPRELACLVANQCGRCRLVRLVPRKKPAKQ